MSVVNLYRRDSQPFAQIPLEVIRDPEISSNAFRLLAYLMSHRDGYQLTYEQIERQTGLGRFAINQASTILVSKRWLDVERPKLSNGQFGAKSWTVLDGSTSTSVGNSTMEPHHMEPTTHLRRTLNKEEHLKENLAQDELERARQKKAENEKLREAFNQFWSVYPRRVGKQSAWSAFKKAFAEDGQLIVDGAQRLARDPNLPPKQFIPHPATWLNRQGWFDEPYPERELTPEEKRQRELAEIARKREVERRYSEQMLRESEEARARSTPPPICEHGNKIISCRECLKR